MFKQAVLGGSLFLASMSVFAEECLPGFGPGCVTPGVPVPEQRIPINAYVLQPIFIEEGQYASVEGQVIGNFAVLTATLPDGYQVAGISPMCFTETPCPNLGLLAWFDLKLRFDQALRSRAFQ